MTNDQDLQLFINQVEKNLLYIWIIIICNVKCGSKRKLVCPDILCKKEFTRVQLWNYMIQYDVKYKTLEF